jgi:PilZ domain
MVTKLLRSLGQMLRSADDFRRRKDRDGTPAERRSSARCPTVPNDGWLGWRENETFCQVAIYVEDVSQNGAKVTLDRLPPANASLWLRLESPRATGWCPVLAARSCDNDSGTYELGLQFPESCSYELNVGLCGLSSSMTYGYRTAEAETHERCGITQ